MLRLSASFAQRATFTPHPFRHSARFISAESLDVVKSTLPAVAAAGTKFTDHFYNRMFAAHPELGNVFNQSNRKSGTQSKALFSSIAASAVSLLETGQLPRDMLETVHHKHCALNVEPAQYDVVGEHILGTIRDLLNPPKEVIDAWAELYTDLAAECVHRSEALYQEAEQKPGGWRGEREFKLARKVPLSSNVMEFTFEAANGKRVSRYTPGQYITLWVKARGWEYRQPRHYTLLQETEWKEGQSTYTIAVKRRDDGTMSKYLHDDLLLGDRIYLSPPFGDFHMNHASQMWINDSRAPVVLLSAGVGITPTMSMLSSLRKGQRPVIWLHAAKSGAEHPFREYLRGLAHMMDKEHAFTRRVWYETPREADVKSSENTGMYHFEGRMDLEQVKDLLPLHDKHAMFFFCGPKPWMVNVAKQLCSFGVKRSNIEFESFGPSERDEILA